MLLLMYVGALSLYAWRDWFASLCGAILLMAVVEHPDMPNSMGGIQGLNPWNMLMLVVLLAWLRRRRAEGLTFDLPLRLGVMLFLYFLVILASFSRLWLDPSGLEDYSSAYLVSEYLINCVKWVLPGALLYDGCRSRTRTHMALACILMVYVLLSLQVIRWMPMASALSGGDLSERSAKIILNEVGYHRVNMSMLLAGAFWAVVSTLMVFRKRLFKLAILGSAAILALGQALTAGRTGYATWGLVGLVLCTLRWRRLLLLPPALALCVVLFMPGVAERMTAGFGGGDGPIKTQADTYEITSGRSLIWPYVTKEIGKSPLIGHGRQAMIRTGLAHTLLTEMDEEFPHPHNAYLEMLLDNGLVGFLCVIPFYFVILRYALRLFLDREDNLNAAVGGAALALLLALLIAALGSQTFYPREGAVGMWCAIGLLLRRTVDRDRQDGSETGDEQPA
jgi:O-antigen ligase